MAQQGHVKQFQSFGEASSFIWSVADLIRGAYKQHDFGKVILPLAVLRRLDCVLGDTKAAVLKKHEALKGGSVKNLDPILNKITGVHFHNTSKLDFTKLVDDPGHIAANLTGYVKGFSANVREIFVERFKLQDEVETLDKKDLLYFVVKRFAEVDLHPSVVDNHMMGAIFEDLIRRFAEQSNETAGEHFTPREVIRLMVNLLLHEDDDALRTKGVVRTLLDPACGTGGMLSIAQEYLLKLNPEAHLEVFGQELNDETYGICKADMLIKGVDPENIAPGNSFSDDGHPSRDFDYMLSNPPFGVDWKSVEKRVADEHETLGYKGRFGAGLPRINDGSFLFLQHMISKMKPVSEGGSRIAIVFNGSPLFTGDAGGGESEIRRWIIENDWLEAVVGLPDQLFFNTGITTYVWIVTNRKAKQRRGKVQLIDATAKLQKMRKSLGNKRNELSEQHIREITEVHGDFVESDVCKIFGNDAFGYWKITVERPLRLSFQATPERIARVNDAAPFANLTKSKKKGSQGADEVREGQETQAKILVALRKVDNAQITSRPVFEKKLEDALAGIKLSSSVFDAIVDALGERDETAEICRNAKGKPESDAELRDTENVPLGDDIDAYVTREVRPHVPDAWVDVAKTKKGYEIPFTRHFYKYTPPRPLALISDEIRALQNEIQALLQAAS